MPATISELFGQGKMTVIYGVVLTAWSAGGVIGPQITAFIKDKVPERASTAFLHRRGRLRRGRLRGLAPHPRRDEGGEGYSAGLYSLFRPKALRTLSGMKGVSVILAPTAFLMALAIAAGGVSMPISATDLAPKGPVGS